MTNITSKHIIGTIIKKQRGLRHITQQQLADLLLVDRQYVWRIESGKINLTLNYLDIVIEKLKCGHNDFIVSDFK